jgi:DNA-binding MarR family transcriptional regulator
MSPKNESAQLADELRPALLRLARGIRNQRVDMSVTLAQLSALVTLRNCGPLGAGELAAHERVQPPTMTKVLSQLEERGFVERKVNPSDKRQAIIEITDAGQSLLASERELRNQWLAERLANLDAADRQLLHTIVPVLDRLVQQ